MQLRGPSSAGFMYADTGGSGPFVVILHGVLMKEIAALSFNR